MVNLLFGLVKRNKINICGIMAIIYIAITLGVCYIETNQKMQDNIDDIKNYNVEDFSFFPNVTQEDILKYQGDYSKTLNDKVDKLSKKYNFLWQRNKYLVLSQDKRIVRLFSDKRTINKYKIIDGNTPEKNQIMIDYRYAKANKLEIGDYFNIDNQKYEISAVLVFPDMISPIVDNAGKIYDKNTQCLAVVNDADFINFSKDRKVNLIFSGVFLSKDDNNINLMKMDDDFEIFLESNENPQVFSTVKSQLKMNEIIVGFSMGVLFSIAICLVLLTINEHIKCERKNIGVLKALGYKNIELTKKYLFYFFIILIPAIAGYFTGHFLVEPFYESIFGNYLFPFVDDGIILNNVILFAVIPSVIFSLFGFAWALFKIRKPALTMINEKSSSKINKLVYLKNKKITHKNYLRGVKSTLLLSNIMALIFVMFSGFALGVQIQFAYTTYNMTSSISDFVLKEYNYNYNVRFTELLENTDKHQDSLKYLSKNIRLKDKVKEEYVNLNLCIVDDKNMNLLNLRTKSGKKIALQEIDGVVINEWMKVKYKLDVGDKISIILDNKEYSTKIKAISQSVSGINIYVGEKAALNHFKIDNKMYNGIFTNNIDATQERNVLNTISKSETKKTLEQSTGIYVVISVMLFVCGLVIGVITLMISLFSVMNSSKKYIALMKILGYTKKECNYAIVNRYRVVAILGFIISIPYTILLSQILFSTISTSSNTVYPASISIISIIGCFIITIVVIEILLLCFRKKMEKISFKEIMEG